MNIIEQFRDIYYQSKCWAYGNTSWRGYEIEKNPLDLWIYQEIIAEVKPEIIIEFGTFKGGSAIYFADILKINGLKDSKVISVDIDAKEQPEYDEWGTVEYLNGSSINSDIFKIIEKECKNRKTLIVEDSDHSYQHIIDELNLYKDLVSVDSYFIVEDGYPCEEVLWAIKDFLKNNKNFQYNEEKEKFHMTFNPKGYLKRIK